jgi:hypothetical protein
MSINEKGEPELGDASAREVNISNEEMEKMIMKAQNFNELYENLRGSGVYLEMENSKVVMMPVNEGTIIFFNDGQVQDKIVLDKEISPDVALQIQNAKDRDDLEEILIQNNVIERPEEEMDKETTLNDRTVDIDRAENVNMHDELNMSRDSAIAENRYARYNDPDRKVSRAGMDR